MCETFLVNSVNPGLLHPTPGLEWGAPPAYRGLGEQEEHRAPGGEEVPHTQTGPGTVDMSSPARVRSLAMPSPDGPLLPAHKAILDTSSYSTHTPYKIHQNFDINNWFENVVNNGKCSEAQIKKKHKNTLWPTYWTKCIGRIVTKSMSYFLHVFDCSLPYCATLET